MAKSLTTVNGTLLIPGGYSSYKVQNNPGGLATTGVLFLLGESDAGPAYSLETDLEENSYGPDQLADVVAKYKSGPLVDAFRGAVAAANDPDITGSFNRAIPVKTNLSAKASGTLLAVGGGDYATIADKSWGKLGNQIQVAVTQNQAETSAFSFTFVPPATIATSPALNGRVNGGAIGTPVSLATTTTPAAVVAGLALTGATVTGGADRLVLGGTTGTLAGTASGSSMTFTRSTAWDVTPTVGDTLQIASTASNFATAAATANAIGWWIVTAATSTTITATRIVGSGTLANISADTYVVGNLTCWSPITVTPTATLINGYGKSVELFVSGGTFTGNMLYSVGTTTAGYLSTSLAPLLNTASAEQKITLTASRASDLVSETYTVGGEIPFTIGYVGTTATMSITDTTLTTTVTGGSGANLSLDLADYSSITELCTYISSQTGYTASAGTAAMGLYDPVNLDTVTNVGICSQFGTVKPGRVKWDAYKFNKALADGSSLVQLGIVADTTTAAGAGLPQVQSTFFLSGGTRGGTSDANISSALTALEQVSGNFLVPLFSRDAAGLDITDGITDTASTYTLAGVQAACKSHVLAMSQYKRQRNRQALLSVQDTFDNQKTIAANTASYRCNMPFQNMKELSATGSIVTYQPWMAAVKAAAMQAAGFYKSIEWKGINCSGVTHDAGDFDPRNDSNLEDALLAGLMPIKRLPTGGYIWVSDQTTYGRDSNFVWNSMQAVYAADTVSLTVAQRMAQAFVGQSLADVNATIALSFLSTVLDDMFRLRLIASSDDALKGYRNASIRISGNAMLVSVELKLATSLSFVDISFLVAPVQQSA